MSTSNQRTVIIAFITLLFILLVCLSSYAQETNQNEQIITAANFKNNSGQGKYDYLKAAIPDSVITNLAVSKKLTVVERSQLAKTLQEQGLSMEGIVDERTAAQAGKTVGAAVVIIGDFLIIEDEIRINARLVEVETAKIIKAAKVQGNMGKEIFNLIDQVSEVIVKKLIGKEIEKEEKPSNKAPQANFSYSPSSPRVGDTVQFDAAVSKDIDGTIVLYEWDFDGDQIIDARGSQVSHQFPSKGSYSTRLTVRDNTGNADSTTKVIDVLPSTEQTGKKETSTSEQPEITKPKSTQDFSEGRRLGIRTILILPICVKLSSSDHLALHGGTSFSVAWFGLSWKFTNYRIFDAYIGARYIWGVDVHYDGPPVLPFVGAEISWSPHWSIYAELWTIFPIGGIAFYF